MEEIAVLVFVLFPAVILHEYAHGWVAYRRGDATAKLAGRLTLNPMRHVDPVGTILIPAMLLALRLMGKDVFIFGWAKPVPVNFWRLRNPKRDMIGVGLAGPAVNIFLAVLFSQVLKFDLSVAAYQFVSAGVYINLLLAVFNMVPIPPLDGSRLVMGLLPEPLAQRYGRLEPYGIFIVVVLISLGLFDAVILPLIEIGAQWLGVSFR